MKRQRVCPLTGRLHRYSTVESGRRHIFLGDEYSNPLSSLVSTDCLYRALPPSAKTTVFYAVIKATTKS